MRLQRRITIAIMLGILLSSLSTVRTSELWIQMAGWVLIAASASVIVWEVIRGRQEARGRD